MLQEYTSVEGIPTWLLNRETGDTTQSGSATLGDGVVLGRTPSPPVPSTGGLRMFTPDGLNLALQTAIGEVTYVTASDTVTVAPATGVYATDTASANAAIAQAGVGGVVYFPSGTYVVDGLVALTAQTFTGYGTLVRPASSTASIITTTGNDGFTINGLVIDGGSLQGNEATSNPAIAVTNSTWCRVLGTSIQNCPAGNAGLIIRGGVRCIAAGMQITNVGYGIICGLLEGDSYSCNGNLIYANTIDTTVNDAIFLTSNIGSAAATVAYTAIGTVVSHCTVRNFGDCGVEIGSGSMNVQVGTCTFIGISNGSGNNGILFRDAQFCSASDCQVSNLTKTGSCGVNVFNLNGSNNHNSINNIDVNNCAYGYYVNGSTSGGTVGTAVTDFAVNGGRIFGCANDGIHLTNDASISITGTHVRNSGQQGVSIGQFSLSSATYISLTGCQISNSGQSGTGESGVIIFQSSARVNLSNCLIYDDQSTPTQSYGVRIFDTTVGAVTISECDVTNGGITANILNASTTGPIRIFRCLGYNPQGVENVLGGITASPWTYTAGITPEVLYLEGGTVSGVTKNSFAIPYNSASGSAYPLEPGESITMTYSVAPTLAKSDRK